MGGINLYGFVGNDGVNQWDLLGLTGGIEMDISFSLLLSETVGKGTIAGRESNMSIAVAMLRATWEIFGNNGKRLFTGVYGSANTYHRGIMTLEKGFPPETLLHELTHAYETITGEYGGNTATLFNWHRIRSERRASVVDEGYQIIRNIFDKVEIPIERNNCDELKKNKNNVAYKDIEKLSIIDVFNELDRSIPIAWLEYNDAVDRWGQGYKIKAKIPSIQIISNGPPNRSKKSGEVSIYASIDFSDIL